MPCGHTFQKLREVWRRRTEERPSDEDDNDKNERAYSPFFYRHATDVYTSEVRPSRDYVKCFFSSTMFIRTLSVNC